MRDWKSSIPITVVGCIALSRRARIEAALDGNADILWCESFAGVTSACAAGRRPTVVILDARDPAGVAAGTVAATLANISPETTVVLYATHQEIVAGALSSPAITELLVAGDSDGRFFVRTIMLNAVKRIAANRVVRGLASRVPGSILPFAESAVRQPSIATVEAVAQHLGVHRQTLATWCRKENFMRPEELLVWCRVLLVGAMLEQTDHSVATLAVDFDFPSPVALRNQLKRYTGMTAQEIRSAGLDMLLQLFGSDVQRRRHRRHESAHLTHAVEQASF